MTTCRTAAAHYRTGYLRQRFRFSLNNFFHIIHLPSTSNASNFLIDVNANLDSPDVLAAGASTPNPNDYGNGRNRFYLPFSNFSQGLKDGQVHQIYAYPIDYPSGLCNANVILTDPPLG